MAEAQARKGVRKELSTFISWGKESVIGHKEEVIGSKTYVTQIWCKLCAKHKNDIRRDPSIKGAALVSIKAFTEGTNVVTKYQVITLRNMFI